jgi:GR25 family glycosyltransferase involved in LPS biosynthesis
MIDVFYINLANSAGRRKSVEQSFYACNFSEDWKLHRQEAFGATSPDVLAKAGSISAPLKGNWLSHVECAKQALAQGGNSHALIIEDDTVFANNIEYFLTTLVESLPSDVWDVIYIDAIISDAADMHWFFKLRNKFIRDNCLNIIPLKRNRRCFVGASAYLVNKLSLRKFVTMVDIHSMPFAYDLYLRNLVQLGMLKGFMTFPFLTTMSRFADETTVDYTSDRHLQEVFFWNAFRRLVWIGSGEPDERVAEGEKITTNDVKRLQDIVSPLLSLQMGWHTGESLCFSPSTRSFIPVGFSLAEAFE